ncbi:MAG: hypothetical protein NTW21_00535 [Verrucomicrobia bacterium]|nr:hypothetical protein [Verrucomicrobiota bacterium]
MPNLDTHLQALYHNDSELIVVCLCHMYNQKEWCGIEWRAIRDLMNQRQSASIMFLRVDSGDVDGIFGTIDGFITVNNDNIDDVTSKIIERHSIL